MRMWRLFPALAFLFLSQAGYAQTPSIEQRYVALLIPTESERPEEDELARLQAGHMANIRRMAEAGILLVAGPARPVGAGQTPLAGVWIFSGADAELTGQADAMMAEDPMIAAGLLRAETHILFFETGDNLYERRPRGE